MKYHLNQTIYYLKDNKLHSATVRSRTVVENAESWATPFGESRIEYATAHGVFSENEVFASRRELVQFLLGENEDE